MHLPADGHLRCLRVGAVVNEAAVSAVILCGQTLSFSWVCAEKWPCWKSPAFIHLAEGVDSILEMRKLRPPRGEVTCQRDHTAHKC